MAEFDLSLKDGRTITVGEDFMKMTEPQRQEWLAGVLQKEAGRSLKDSAVGGYRAFDEGVATGAAGLIGLPRLATDLGAKGIEKASDFISDKLGIQRYERPAQPGPVASFLDKLPRSEDVKKEIYSRYYGGDGPAAIEPGYKPQNDFERYMQTIGEFSIGGPGRAGASSVLGRVAQRTANMTAPAVLSETAGHAVAGSDVAKDNPWLEPTVRFLSAVTAGGLSSLASRSRTAEDVIARELQYITPEAVERAVGMMQNNVTPLTFPEALSQVVGRPALTNVLRHLEASPDTAPRMEAFFGSRPENVTRAADRATEALSPGQVANPYATGPAVGRAAEETINDIRRVINNQTEHLYAGSRGHEVPPAIHDGMMQNPLFADTLREVRESNVYGQAVAAHSDRSIAMYDAVAKRMEERGRNLGKSLNPDESQFARSLLEQQGQHVKDTAVIADRIATQGPSGYEAALARQQQLRDQHLNPLLEGGHPLGRLAEKDLGTKNAIDILFPTGEDALRHGEQQVAQAVQHIRNRSPAAAADLVRAYAEMTFNKAARDLQTAPNQALGAKWRQRIIGTRQEEANLQAAITHATPDGAQRWEGFQRLMDIMEATGARLNVGSRTSYNDEIRQAMKGRGGLAEVAAKVAADPVSAGKPLIEKAERWKYGNNLDQIATMFTDPNAARMLVRLAGSGARSYQGERIGVALINYINASTAHRQPPTELPPVTINPPQ